MLVLNFRRAKNWRKDRSCGRLVTFPRITGARSKASVALPVTRVAFCARLQDALKRRVTREYTELLGNLRTALEHVPTTSISAYGKSSEVAVSCKGGFESATNLARACVFHPLETRWSYLPRCSAYSPCPKTQAENHARRRRNRTRQQVMFDLPLGALPPK